MNIYSYKNVIDFKNICRTCMGIDSTHTKISDTVKVGKQSVDALQILNMLCEVKKIKDYPERICFNCLEFVKDIYKFKLQIEKSESVLRRHLGPPEKDCNKTNNNSTSQFLDLDKYAAEHNEKNSNNDYASENSLDNDLDDADIIEPKMEMLDQTDHRVEIESTRSNRSFQISCPDTSLKLFDNILENYGVEPEENSAQTASDSNFQLTDSGVASDQKLQPVNCPICQKTLKTKYILQTHMKRHNLKGQFHCMDCGKAFNSKACLRKHATIHNGDKNLTCKICDKKYFSANNLNMHLKTHTGQKPFLCSLCGRSYTNATGLNFHMKSHKNEKPFMCEVCDKTFIVQSHLDQHSKIHTGEKPFKCGFCEKGFVKKFDLKRHEAIHTGDKPFKCEFCDKSFIMKVHYQYHTRLHKNERPFVCHLCKKGFIRRYYLKNHYQKHHDTLKGSIFDTVGHAI